MLITSTVHPHAPYSYSTRIGIASYTRRSIARKKHSQVGKRYSYYSLITNLCCFPSYTSAPTGPPLSLAVQSVNSTSLLLSWEPPSLAHQNGATLNYTLICIPPAESSLPPVISVFTTAGARTLSGLAPATLYSCSLCATNLYGNGPPANISAMTEDGGMI